MNWFPNQGIAFMACIIFIVGLLIGRAAMSIGMMALFGSALLDLKLSDTFNKFRKDRSAILLSGLFILYALSFFWSENTVYFMTRIQLVLPFLVLPFAFKSISWNRVYYDYLAMVFIVVCTLGASWSLWQYMQDIEAINAAYGVSKSMPTPFAGDHIRFGVAVVIAISFCFQLIKKPLISKWFWIIIAAFLITYLHLLAGKTALLSLYIIILFEIIRLIVHRRKVGWGFSLLALLILLPIIFYYTSSSFNNKVNYSIYSYYELFNTEAQTNVSDEGRIVSYQIALGVIKENILFGVGVGDGLDEMEQAYSNNQIKTTKILYPHNQFIYISLVLGVMGLLYFLYCGIYIFRKHFFRSIWIGSFLLIFIIPFMVEAFFNTQYGIALFLFFFLLLESRERSVKTD